MAELGFHWPSLVVYLVNFTILLGILYAVGYKPILRMLDQRSINIRESLEQAEQLRKESAERQNEMGKQLQESRREGQVLIDEARTLAEQYREEERGRVRREAEVFLSRAREDIERERDNAVEQVRERFADLAITAAEKVIGRSLNSDAHVEIVDQVLEKDSLVERDR